MYNIYTVCNRIKHMPDWIYYTPTKVAAVSPFGMVQNTYRTRTVSTHLCLHFILKIMLNRSLKVILWPFCWLLKEIINHNRSKFVLSKLVLPGVCCKNFMYTIHVCTVRVHFLVCTWSVCLPSLWSDFYLTSRIPTIFV